MVVDYYCLVSSWDYDDWLNLWGKVPLIYNYSSGLFRTYTRCLTGTPTNFRKLFFYEIKTKNWILFVSRMLVFGLGEVGRVANFRFFWRNPPVTRALESVLTVSLEQNVSCYFGGWKVTCTPLHFLSLYFYCFLLSILNCTKRQMSFVDHYHNYKKQKTVFRFDKKGQYARFLWLKDRTAPDSRLTLSSLSLPWKSRKSSVDMPFLPMIQI